MKKVGCSYRTVAQSVRLPSPDPKTSYTREPLRASVLHRKTPNSPSLFRNLLLDHRLRHFFRKKKTDWFNGCGSRITAAVGSNGPQMTPISPQMKSGSEGQGRKSASSPCPVGVRPAITLLLSMPVVPLCFGPAAIDKQVIHR